MGGAIGSNGKRADLTELGGSPEDRLHTGESGTVSERDAGVDPVPHQGVRAASEGAHAPHRAVIQAPCRCDGVRGGDRPGRRRGLNRRRGRPDRPCAGSAHNAHSSVRDLGVRGAVPAVAMAFPARCTAPRPPLRARFPSAPGTVVSLRADALIPRHHDHPYPPRASTPPFGVRITRTQRDHRATQTAQRAHFARSYCVKRAQRATVQLSTTPAPHPLIVPKQRRRRAAPLPEWSRGRR